MQQNVVEPAHHERTREEELALKNKRTGLTIFQVSWIMAFVSLIFVNLQLRFQYPSWPPPGAEVLDPLLPTIATIGLIISSWMARRGLQAIANDRIPAFLMNWRLAMGLGVAFVAVMIYEWVNVTVTTQYGALFRLMTGFHGVHAFVIGGIMLYVYRRGQKSAYHADEFWAVEGAAKLWYFVTIAWMLFYFVLYWI